MNRRGAWGAMAQRVHQGREAGAGGPQAAAREAVPTVKHCWVDDVHGRLPGLLLEWSRTESGYRGRVVRPVLDAELGWIVVEEWLPAHLLAPA